MSQVVSHSLRLALRAVQGARSGAEWFRLRNERNATVGTVLNVTQGVSVRLNVNSLLGHFAISVGLRTCLLSEIVRRF